MVIPQTVRGVARLAYLSAMRRAQTVGRTGSYRWAVDLSLGAVAVKHDDGSGWLVPIAKSWL